ncbi:MAG TPA: hypothetical protein VM925_30145, partial [Labilithrix sp.]|nr:hypothetical protein [Labilithrix sp.]
MHRRISTVLGALALTIPLCACGGNTTPQPGSSGADLSSSSGGRPCTEIGCDNGVRIDFSYRDPGDYVFEVTVDGTKVTCKATLPLPQQPPDACDGPGVLLGLVGSMLPADQQSIGGLILSATTARSISVHAMRGSTVLGDKTFAPPYVTR